MDIDWVGSVRLFLHVTSATVWVGEVQLVRALGARAPRARSRTPRGGLQPGAYNRVAWPAYWVLVATGIWNIAAEQAEAPKGWETCTLKVALVALSGVSAFLHARPGSTTGLAVWGALSGL